MENGTDAGQSEGKDPSSFLGEIIGSPVVVKLNSGVVYKGELQSVDGYMNIALENTEEYVGGVKRRTYGDAFVRGNNGPAASMRRAPSAPTASPEASSGSGAIWLSVSIRPQSSMFQITPTDACGFNKREGLFRFTHQ